MKIKMLMLIVACLSFVFMVSCDSDVKDGVDGNSSLMSMSEEPAGENCVFGGTKVDAGKDLNSNGELDEDEILVTSYVCNGEDGTNGTNGTNGTDGEDGTNGTNGTDGEDGTNGTNGEDGTNGTNGTDGEDGTNGTDGEDGTNGTDGEDGNDAVCYENSAPVIGSIMINDTEYLNTPVEVKPSEDINLIINTTDIDGDDLQYTVLGPYSSVESTGDGAFSMTIDETGIHNFSLVISDGCQIVMRNFSIIGAFNDLSLYAGGSCMINEGKAYCWGRNFDGELGIGSTVNQSLVPVAVDDSGVLSGKELISIYGGRGLNCVLDTQRRIYCWGQGIPGDGSSYSNYTSPVAVDMDGVLSGKIIKKVDTRGSSVCAIDFNGKVYCWGGNSNGQLGDGTDESRLVPVAVDDTGVLNGKNIVDISLGERHACAIDSDGKVYCWGSNEKGQLGDGNGGCLEWNLENCMTPLVSNVPIEVDMTGVLSGKSLVSVSCGPYFTCALDSEGKVYCWGSNKDYNLGDGTDEDRLIPVAVDTTGVLNGKTLVSLEAGYSHACVLDLLNDLYCWGLNSSGQLGNATFDSSDYPVAVDKSGVLSGVKINKLSSGNSHSCVLSEENDVYCWGSGDVGRLGNNSTANSNVAVKVNPLP